MSSCPPYVFKIDVPGIELSVDLFDFVEQLAERCAHCRLGANRTVPLLFLRFAVARLWRGPLAAAFSCLSARIPLQLVETGFVVSPWFSLPARGRLVHQSHDRWKSGDPFAMRHPGYSRRPDK